MQTIREIIAKLITDIRPFDELERAHQEDALAWIGSGVEIFRIEKPATPPKHLVVYFVVLDETARSVLLVDHIKAEKWLPTGGHVDVNEDPKTTVAREAMEELSLSPAFLTDAPLFITEMVTVGKTAGHTDVNLWYVITAREDDPITADPREFNGFRWFTLDEVLTTDIATLDPHMHRFITKLKSFIRG